MDIDLLQIDCDVAIDLQDPGRDAANEETKGQTAAGQAELCFWTEIAARAVHTLLTRMQSACCYRFVQARILPVRR